MSIRVILNTLLKSGVAAFLLSMAFSPNLSAQVEALGSCQGITTSNTYGIQVTNLSDTATYTVLLNGSTVVMDSLIGTTTFWIPNVTFVDGTVTNDVLVIINSNTVPDTTELTVHEVLCMDANKDGTLDFNTATCDYTVAMPNSGTIVSTVAPYNSNSVYLYVLSDSSGQVANPIVYNYSGHFTNLEDGEYRVSAYHFLTTTDAADFIGDLTAGVSDLDDFGSMSAPVCYNFCGFAKYSVGCPCIVNIDAPPADEEVCEDDLAIFSVSGSITTPIPPDGILTYQWQRKPAGGSFSNISGATDSLYEIPAATVAMNNDTFRVLVSLDVLGTTICTDTSFVATLTVNTKPVMDPNLDNALCSDDAIGVILGVDVGSIAADSFNIINIDSGGLISSAGLPVLGYTSDVNEIADDAWTNTTGASVDVVYTVAPMSDKGCIGDTISITVTITPEPSYAGPVTTTVCSDEPIGVVIPSTDDSSLAMDSFVVSAIVNSNLTGTPTEGGTVDVSFIENDMFNNVSGVNDTVTYTVIPYSNNCEGSPFDIYVIVTPEPLFTGDLDEMVCSDVAIDVNLPAQDDSSLAIDSFSITASTGDSLTGTPTIGTGITSISAIAGDIYTNTSTAVDSVIYTITPYSAGCEGESFTITVQVTPEPVGFDPTPSICSDVALDISLQDLVTNGMSNVTFQWYATDNTNVTGETTSSSTADDITDILTNVSSSDQEVVYTIIPTSAAGDGSCVGDTFYVTVTVTSEPVADDEMVTYCSKDTLDINLLDNITNGVSIAGFNYTVNSDNQSEVPAASARTDTSSANITDVYSNLTDTIVTITYTVTPISVGGCAGDPFEVKVEIDPQPILASTLDTTVCSNEPASIVLSVDVNSVGATSYDIVMIDSVGITLIGGSPATGVTANINEIADDVWENKTSAPVTVVYHVVPISADGCRGEVVEITLTINPEAIVDAGITTTICSNGTLDLSSLGASITGGITTGTWSSSSGTFDNTSFATGTTFTPSAAQIDAGQAVLTLTSDDPAGPCGTESDTVTIIINDVRCSQFPWNGND